MRSLVNKMGFAFAAAVAVGSCNWGTFDDLKEKTGVTLVDQDDAPISGDFAIEIAALPPTGDGASLVIAGGASAGIAQLVLDGSGERTSFVGFDADPEGRGSLRPIKSTSPPHGIAVIDATTYLVAVQDINNVVEFKTGVTSPRELIAGGGRTNTGRSVAVGNLGIGTAALDVVVSAVDAITIIPDGTGTPVSCGLISPKAISTQPFIPAEHVKIARIDSGSGPEQIIVGANDGNGVPRVYMLDASQVQGASGTECPTNTSIQLSGTSQPSSVAVGDVDGNGELDLVLGTPDNERNAVQVILNPKRGQAAAPMIIPTQTADPVSEYRGGRIRIANLDSTAGNEIVVADPRAVVGGDGDAGIVFIYRWGTSANCTPVGPACLVRTLYDASGAKYFGRSLAIVPFKTGSTTTNLLAVGQKDQVVIYFKLSPDATDPRQ